MKRKEKNIYKYSDNNSFKNRNKLSFHGVISWKANFFNPRITLMTNMSITLMSCTWAFFINSSRTLARPVLDVISRAYPWIVCGT